MAFGRVQGAQGHNCYLTMTTTENCCQKLSNLVAAIDQEWSPESHSQYFTTELCNAIDAARAATGNPPANAWQPIETAPRDGRDFIAYNKFTGPYITAAKAMPPDGEIRYPMHCWHGVKGSWFPEPTHWQPLPSPPPITP